MPEPPILVTKWYDYAKWIVERVDSFPKNQRFIFDQRLAWHALDIMELLIEATYARDKAALLHTANRKIEMLRWFIRTAKDHARFTWRQYEFSCERIEQCGRMTGGWLKQTTARRRAGDEDAQASLRARLRAELLRSMPKANHHPDEAKEPTLADVLDAIEARNEQLADLGARREASEQFQNDVIAQSGRTAGFCCLALIATAIWNAPAHAGSLLGNEAQRVVAGDDEADNHREPFDDLKDQRHPGRE